MEKLSLAPCCAVEGKSSNIGLTFALIHCVVFFLVRRTAHIPLMGLLYGYVVGGGVGGFVRVVIL